MIRAMKFSKEVVWFVALTIAAPLAVYFLIEKSVGVETEGQQILLLLFAVTGLCAWVIKNR